MVCRNSLAVQWLGLQAFTAKGPDSILGQGAKIPKGVQRNQKKKKKKGLWMCFGYLLSKEKSGILVIFPSWEMEYFLPYQQTKDVTVISYCSHHGRWALRKLRMWKYRILAPDSWGTYQRNDFSEPGFLHIPIHRKPLNSLTCHIWLSFN